MTRARELADLGNPNAITVGVSSFVGIGSETPGAQLDVGKGDLIVGAAITLGGPSGIISATSFSGSGSGLTGLPGQADFWIKTAAGINTTVSVGIGTTRPDSIARVNNTSITNVGILTAYQIYGDGSNLTGLPGQVDLWSKTAAGINTLSSVGVGTTNPVADLTVGPVGTSGTSLFVHGDVRVVGVVTATSFYGDGSTLTNAGITAGKSVGLAAFFA